MRVNPMRYTLSMIPKKCEKCENIQYTFFTSQKQFDEWECPVCRDKRMKDMEIQELEKSGQEILDMLDKEVQEVYDDLEEDEGYNNEH